MGEENGQVLDTGSDITPSQDENLETTPTQELETPEGGDSQPASKEDDLFEWSGRKLTKDEYVAETQKLLKEFHSRNQTQKELEDKLKALEAGQAKAQEPDPMQSMTPEEVAQLNEVVDKLLPFLAPKLEDKFKSLTVSTLDQRRQEEALVQHYNKEFEKVEEMGKKYGIQVNRQDLGEYMQSSGIMNVEAAFRSKHFQELVDGEIKSRTSKQRKVPADEGGKVPPKPTIPEDTPVTSKDFKTSLVEKLKRLQNGE